MDSLQTSIPAFVSKQALSKARQRISHEAFLKLFCLCVEQFYNLPTDLHTWHGFHIYAVDGSTIQIPESAENYNVFGRNPNSIIVFDRRYPAEKMSRFLNSRGILFLIRIPKTFKKAILKENDSLFEYPASCNKSSLTFRGIHFPLAEGTTGYPVTNIMAHQLNTEQFFELYHLRWRIESKYREFKNRFEIESFNSVKPVKISQLIDEASKVLSSIRTGRKFGRYQKHTRRQYYNSRWFCVSHISISPLGETPMYAGG